MVGALFTLIGGIERNTRRLQGASTLSLLQVLADSGPARPSEIAERQGVHPSLITRQLKDLEDQGHVSVAQDPADGRAWLVALTGHGKVQVRRLQRAGIDRFALFVEDWGSDEVRTLTTLLEKLEQSKAAVAQRERDQTPPSRAQGRRTARRLRPAQPEKPA
jgi:DNA-binding MarR family transcriptional regulator